MEQENYVRVESNGYFVHLAATKIHQTCTKVNKMVVNNAITQRLIKCQYKKHI